MLRGGGSLTEIGQVLRQRSPGSTAIYAKVDVDGCAPLPGPGRPGRRRSALRALEDYLGLRRALGFRLGQHGSCCWVRRLADDRGADTITTELAWPGLPPGGIKPMAVDPAQHGPRVRRLPARHRPGAPGSPARTDGSAGTAADPLYLPRRVRSPTSCAEPSGYSPVAGGHLPDPGRPSGSKRRANRGGDCFDPRRPRPDQGMVTVRHAKFGRTRLVPLHPSAPPPSGYPARGTGSAPPRGPTGCSCPSPGGPCGGERLTRSAG